MHGELAPIDIVPVVAVDKLIQNASWVCTWSICGEFWLKPTVSPTTPRDLASTPEMSAGSSSLPLWRLRRNEDHW
jgi:hypothetical protein